jgi:hypothetical protein
MRRTPHIPPQGSPPRQTAAPWREAPAAQPPRPASPPWPPPPPPAGARPRRTAPPPPPRAAAPPQTPRTAPPAPAAPCAGGVAGSRVQQVHGHAVLQIGGLRAPRVGPVWLCSSKHKHSLALRRRRRTGSPVTAPSSQGPPGARPPHLSSETASLTPASAAPSFSRRPASRPTSDAAATQRDSSAAADSKRRLAAWGGGRRGRQRRCRCRDRWPRRVRAGWYGVAHVPHEPRRTCGPAPAGSARPAALPRRAGVPAARAQGRAWWGCGGGVVGVWCTRGGAGVQAAPAAPHLVLRQRHQVLHGAEGHGGGQRLVQPRRQRARQHRRVERLGAHLRARPACA